MYSLATLIALTTSKRYLIEKEVEFRSSSSDTKTGNPLRDASLWIQQRSKSVNTTLLLVVAALSYSVGGYYMKLSEGLTRGVPTALVLTLFGLGALLQTVAMRHGSMSITYIIVLGIEAITAVVLGVFLLGEGFSPVKMAGIVLVFLGIVVLRS